MSHSQVGLPMERHPPGLRTLFFTEAAERFSFYGMRALLVLYLVECIVPNHDRSSALAIYAQYTSAVYFTPLLGGWLADRFLGRRSAVLVGGILMALGHFVMVWQSMIYVALGLIVMGNGFFKPNIAPLVKGLYPKDSRLIDSAFSWYYMGVNLGAFFAPLVCGWLAQRFGWHYGFAAAGIGMVISLTWFLKREDTLGDFGLPPGRAPGAVPLLSGSEKFGSVCIAIAFAIGIAVVVSCWSFLQPVWEPSFLSGSWVLAYRILLVCAVLLCLRAFSHSSTPAEARPKLTMQDYQELGVILIAALAMFTFVVGFEQAGGTLNLFAAEKVNRQVGAYEVPTSWFQSINPLFIMLLTPLFTMLWERTNLPSVRKQMLGLFLLAVAFFVMVQADWRTAQGKISPFWLVGVYFFATSAELCISPIGLAVVNKLSPPHIVGTMLAIFYLAISAAYYVAGKLEGWLSEWQKASTNPINLWATLAWVSLIAAIIWFLLGPLVRKWSHGKE